MTMSSSALARSVSNLYWKPGAAAAFDADAQHRARRLLAEDFADPARGPFGNRDVGRIMISSSRAIPIPAVFSQ